MTEPPYHQWMLATSAEMMRLNPGVRARPLCLCSPEFSCGLGGPGGRWSGCQVAAVAAVSAWRAGNSTVVESRAAPGGRARPGAVRAPYGEWHAWRALQRNSTKVEKPTCSGCANCRPDLAPLTAAQRAEINAEVDAFMEGERVAARRRLLEARIATWCKPILLPR